NESVAVVVDPVGAGRIAERALQARDVSDRENVLPGYAAVDAVEDQPARGVGIEEGARDAGAGDLEGRPRAARAVRETCPRPGAAQPSAASARVTGLPLDLVVVELDVEVPRA